MLCDQELTHVWPTLFTSGCARSSIPMAGALSGLWGEGGFDKAHGLLQLQKQEGEMDLAFYQLEEVQG